MKTLYLRAITVLIALTASPVYADIFKCVDADGHVMYSNMSGRNCKKLSIESGATSAPSAAAKPAARTATPANFPKVDEGAQKARDNDRRRILESELASEQKSLDQAKKDLAEQEATILPSERMQFKGGAGISGGKVEERLQPFRDKVALHERNIEAIQKELSRLR